jgi:GH24 family phage-related lysozyme (muramidase)
MKRKLSNNGLALIKQFEGCRLTAYKCQSSEQYYTIGYGHYGADVTQGMAITQEQADNLLLKDCDKFVEHVNTYMDKYNFNQNQFDSLVSFAFNIGNINQLTNNGARSISEISSKIPEYCNSGGKKLAGLVTRRNKEKKLFDTPVSGQSITEIAQEVIAGKWGNGDERKSKLASAGYDYNTVQTEVNRLLK